MNENNLKGISEPTITQRPELMIIIEKLRFIVSDYSEMVNITEDKLQLIKKFDEYPIRQIPIIEPECAMDEINNLLETLIELNSKAFNNFKNLGEII
jgi:hypothetical protein